MPTSLIRRSCVAVSASVAIHRVASRIFFSRLESFVLCGVGKRYKKVVR